MALIQDEQLCIPLSSLKEDESVFNFCTRLEKIQAVEDQRFPHDIRVKVRISLVEDDYLVRIRSEGKAEMSCDRCNETFSKVVTGNVDTLFTFNLEKCQDDQDEEVQLIKSQDAIDITQDAVDALLLAVPSKVLCSPECKGLCAQCGSNLNESKCNCASNAIDPRWENLKNIQFEDEE